MNILTFATERQAFIFTNEIQGQLSDGIWENASPHYHWNVWCNAKVTVGEDAGRNFYADKTGYNMFLVIEYVGDRVLRETSERFGLINYTEKDLRDDLRAIKKAMKALLI